MCLEDNEELLLDNDPFIYPKELVTNFSETKDIQLNIQLNMFN